MESVQHYEEMWVKSEIRTIFCKKILLKIVFIGKYYGVVSLIVLGKVKADLPNIDIKYGKTD